MAGVKPIVNIPPTTNVQPIENAGALYWKRDNTWGIPNGNNAIGVLPNNNANTVILDADIGEDNTNAHTVISDADIEEGNTNANTVVSSASESREPLYPSRIRTKGSLRKLSRRLPPHVNIHRNANPVKFARLPGENRRHLPINPIPKKIVPLWAPPSVASSKPQAPTRRPLKRRGGGKYTRKHKHSRSVTKCSRPKSRTSQSRRAR